MNIYKKTIVNDSRNLKNNFKMIFFYRLYKIVMPPVGWHIAVELSVSQSVCQSVRPSENFNGHNFFNIDYRNLIFGIHVHLMELHILSGER